MDGKFAYCEHFGNQKVRSQWNDRFPPGPHNANMTNSAPPYPNHLRAWRLFRKKQDKKLTLEFLANAVGSKKGYLSDIESGKRGLSREWAKIFARLLRTTPEMLFDHPPESVPVDVLDIWSAITEEDRPQALKVLESFVKGAEKAG